MMSPLLATLMPDPSTIVRPRSALPVPRANVTIRPGTLADVPFLDALQKLHTKQVGWMPRAQFEGKIKLGHVLVAEESGQGAVGAGQEKTGDGSFSSSLPTATCPPPTPIAYCIGNDQYFKRDDVGIIYQMNVVPGRQRGFVGAALLRAMFERSAYGCKLFCCWCAQDIAANRFWEAMGFVPLAFRAGGERKGPKGRPRCHIFWQKRIRAGDTTTPWWFPSQTGGGSIRADRIVLPIPPGTHWSDAKPLILPGERVGSGQWAVGREEPKALAEVRRVDESASREAGRSHDASVTTQRPADSPDFVAMTPKRRTKVKATAPAEQPVKPVAFDSLSTRGLRFAPAPTAAAIVPAPVAQRQANETAEPPPVRAPRKKPKNDPGLVSAARELRDRWLEQIDTTPLVSVGKYDVTRTVGETIPIETTPAKRLAA